jgi:hypothetical protein
VQVELHDVGVPIKTSTVSLHKRCAQEKGGGAGDDHKVNQDITNVRGKRDRNVKEDTQAHAGIRSSLKASDCDGVAAEMAANGVERGAERLVGGDGHNIYVCQAVKGAEERLATDLKVLGGTSNSNDAA